MRPSAWCSAAHSMSEKQSPPWTRVLLLKACREPRREFVGCLDGHFSAEVFTLPGILSQRPPCTSGALIVALILLVAV